jgi:hypothetical protein
MLAMQRSFPAMQLRRHGEVASYQTEDCFRHLGYRVGGQRTMFRRAYWGTSIHYLQRVYA